MKATHFEIIGKGFSDHGAIEFLVKTATTLRGCKVVGTKGARSGGEMNVAYREEIVGQPIFDKLVGPAYGGPGRVRYETAKVYEENSR